MPDHNQLLLKVFENLSSKPPQEKNSSYLSIQGGKIFFLNKAGIPPLRELLEFLWKNSIWKNKSTFNEYYNVAQTHLINVLAGKDKEFAVKYPLADLEKTIEDDLQKKIRSIVYYEGCSVVPYPAEVFTIGAVKFSHIEEFAKQKPNSENDPLNGFDEFIQAMKKDSIHWIAEIEIPNVLPERGNELAAISIDLALTSLQLVFHVSEAKGMRRFTSLNPPHQIVGIRKHSNGYITNSFSNKSPGLAYSGPYFTQALQQSNKLLESYGQRINAIATHSTDKLDLSWCDAAYWFHEGVAEPLDTIATAKLETSLENLLHAENSNGSKKRILESLKLFFGKEENDFINPETDLTLGQLAKKLVEDRSRVLHGTVSTLQHDGRFSRTVLTRVAQVLLTQFSLKLDEYKASGAYIDNRKAFVDHLMTKTPPTLVAST